MLAKAGEGYAPHWFRTRPTSLLAALYPHPPGARLSLCPLQALRETSGGATMYTPGGAGTMLWTAHPATHYVLGAPASIIGSELSSLLGSDPSLCPVPMP
jgi:hypothetical protein